MQSVFLNGYFEPYTRTYPEIIELGGNIDLTNQLGDAITGYVDLENIGLAVASSITIDSLPSCGTLYRYAESEGEEDLAIFWEYNAVTGFVVQVEENEVIDFSYTSLFYEDADCGDISDNFMYSVLGMMPVDGPSTTMGLNIEQTIWLVDYGYPEPDYSGESSQMFEF